MNAISSSELIQIQSDAVSMACDQSCQIQRKTPTRDTAGSQSYVWSTVATVQAGMAQPTAGQLANYGYAIGDLATWQVHVPVGTDVRTQDHLVIAGKTLEVQIQLAPRSYMALLTVLASEINNA